MTASALLPLSQFGQDKASGADGALSVWDKNKMAEKTRTTFFWRPLRGIQTRLKSESKAMR